VVKIVYINHGRFPTEKAYGRQIASVCDALADLGHEVTLVSPCFRNTIDASPQEYYGLRHPPRHSILSHWDAFRAWYVPGALAFLCSMLAYDRAVRAFVRQHGPDLLYVRSPLLLAAALATGVPVILELHEIPRFLRRLFVRHCNRCLRIVALTTPMARELISMGVEEPRIVVEPDGVDLAAFATLPDIAASKRRWNLPVDRPVIGYVGSLMTRETLGKGVEDVVDAAAVLTSQGVACFIWIVGGPASAADVLRARACAAGLEDTAIRFQGRIAAVDVPSALAACDICVYPAPASDHPYFQRDTSPLKLVEYIAARKPIVCADIPPVYDIVDPATVSFYAPGDAKSLTAATCHVLKDRRVAQCNGGDITRFDWRSRMERILPPLH
jgi:glycosyltransferase involved in cell wall biosynthesis